jgi:pantothenate kinase
MSTSRLSILLNRIYFVGNFIRNHEYTMDRITFAVDYWSGKTMDPLFLKHDGHLGAIGAFLHDLNSSS